MSTSLCRKICITPPEGIRNERRSNFYSGCSIVAAAGAVSWRCCVSLWKWKYFVWDPKEDTTRNQWLSYIYNTVPEQFNPNIRVCAAHFTVDCFLNLGESSLQCEHYEWLWCALVINLLLGRNTSFPTYFYCAFSLRFIFIFLIALAGN